MQPVHTSTHTLSSLPLSSRSTGATPKKGKVAQPGLRGKAPGRAVIMMAPVSVCHQVSTMGQRFLPTTCKVEDGLQTAWGLRWRKTLCVCWLSPLDAH